MFDLKTCAIPGCFEIQPIKFSDNRGTFVKVFHEEFFFEHGLATNFKEEFYTRSKRGVIRGLHFQVPPLDHEKIVYCTQGEVFDVVLDLRVGSPSYGQIACFKLTVDQGNYLYIPKGLAHGFCAVSENTTLVYKVTSSYSQKHDQGILWSSLDINWPVQDPIISSRDLSFNSLAEFKSPFIYEAF